MLTGPSPFPRDVCTIPFLLTSNSGPTRVTPRDGRKPRGDFPTRRTARPPSTSSYFGTWRGVPEPRGRGLSRDIPSQGCCEATGTDTGPLSGGRCAAAVAPAEAPFLGCASALPGRRRRLPGPEWLDSKITGLVPD